MDLGEMQGEEAVVGMYFMRKFKYKEKRIKQMTCFKNYTEKWQFFYNVYENANCSIYRHRL